MPGTPPVSFFVQCLVDAMYPEVGHAMLRLFEHLDIGVNIPLEQTCCGQPAFNSGYRRDAEAAAKHFIRTFESAAAIVSTSGSCVDMVRHQYPVLFRDDPQWLERARRVGAKTFELTQYLVDVKGVTDIGARYAARVTYHDSCHLSRNLGVARQPRELISQVRGVDFIEMDQPQRCCGFGGTFSVKYPEISTAILDDKIDQILATGADTVVGCDISCLMNIEGRLKRRKIPVTVMHISELLTRSFLSTRTDSSKETV
ncbi:MAG: (Fe-S)-binding protein [Desulfobacteraceae bacterium]|nr:MAG: (Fe-S)-binding protein [Desulfobacteraceae bacterium]